jgi:superfamily II DNA or RNA helicase
MQIATRLASSFDQGIRQRGYQCFRRDLIRIEHGTESELHAEVREIDNGFENYEVVLTWTDSKLALYCDCGYFTSHARPCKHLWAAVLAADQAGHLNVIDTSPEAPCLDLDSLLAGYAEPDQRVIRSPRQAPANGHPAAANWKRRLDQLLKEPLSTRPMHEAWPEGSEVVYLLSPQQFSLTGAISVSIFMREPRKNGGWKSPRLFALDTLLIEEMASVEDREILSLMTGSTNQNLLSRASADCSLSPTTADLLLPRIVRTGRCYLERIEGEALTWDDAGAWKLVARLEPTPTAAWRLGGCFQRDSEQMELTAPSLVFHCGFLVRAGTLARLEAGTPMRWINALRADKPFLIPESDRDLFLSRVLPTADLPRLELPAELRFEELTVSPTPCLKFLSNRIHSEEMMSAELWFDYAGHPIPEQAEERGVFDAPSRRFMVRDREAERSAAKLLMLQGARRLSPDWLPDGAWSVNAKNFPRLAVALIWAGWHVAAEGKSFRRPGKMSASISSGLDWFDLCGEIEYGENSVQLPKLLAALKRGETMVQLADGSFGLLPEEWLKRLGVVAGMGSANGAGIRFSPCQAGLLDALLAAQPEVDCDAAFRQVRQQLVGFEKVEAVQQPAGFRGVLRDYQCEGLGWMHFLRQFSFGGCLADDMGVGKTAQVLALLETRRELRAQGKIDRPSLVVVPKSLIFNWKLEAARFTPEIGILDHTGIGRNMDRLADADVILTTYGTLRRDIKWFKETVFDYVILDEAQAIKNPETESAKAVRLIQGHHRLALSGTPVENHLGELWSLFGFLNPGLLGGSSVFRLAGGALRNPDEETRRLLARALRPFILRRTKEQVASELPAKVEQTIYCEFETDQRALYDELRQHYRASLLPKIGSQGLAKAKIQILEALLRLRQAACHPALVNRDYAGAPSAKLEMLLHQLGQVPEGHKALVFSQFTTLLALVRQRLDADGIGYEYLDGKTRDRQARVDRFQNDPGCRLFLISLKAGGVGLNLTAADYVFILDPWWNPAVEAQAVDRTHRIGQNRQVFAYRLIARDTVEEKILELQQSKRNLADDILGNGNSLIGDLSREDLELLLS